MAENESLPSRLKLLSIETLAVGVLFLLSVFLFGFLMKGILADKPFAFDAWAFDRIRPFINGDTTKVMLSASLLASAYVLFPANLILFIYYLFARHNLFLVRIPVITLVGYLLNELLKRIFSHPRPLDPVFEAATGFSFPSGHSMSAMVFYGMIVYIVWKHVASIPVRILMTAVLVGLIFLIGFSRVYLRVHYASDVLAGFSVGVIYLTVSLWITNSITQRFKKANSRP